MRNACLSCLLNDFYANAGGEKDKKKYGKTFLKNISNVRVKKKSTTLFIRLHIGNIHSFKKIQNT